jgi:DNA-binding MarR family transcriptional regulator
MHDRLAISQPTGVQSPRSEDKTAIIGVLDQLVGYHLRRATGVFMGDYARLSAETGIRQVLFGILSIVATNPGINQGNVGRALAIQPANMVSLANELVARGLLARSVSAGDRRSFALNLTAEGKSMLESCLQSIHDHENRLLADLTGEERQTLMALLRRIGSKASAETA